MTLWGSHLLFLLSFVSRCSSSIDAVKRSWDIKPVGRSRLNSPQLLLCKPSWVGQPPRLVSRAGVLGLEGDRGLKDQALNTQDSGHRCCLTLPLSRTATLLFVNWLVVNWLVVNWPFFSKIYLFPGVSKD